MKKLEGKIAIITGGNSGMGLETAKLFVKEGAKVVITGRRKKELDEAAKAIGSNVTIVQGDVSNLSDLDALYATVKKTHGKVDILFANAGIAQPSSIYDATEAHFDKIFNINVKGLYFTIQKALPLMTNGASIIVNSSVAGRKGMHGFSVYSAAKAAVRSLARSLSQDLNDRKIRINSISPGPIETPIFDTMNLTEQQIKDFQTSILATVPLGRMGTSNEIAKAVLFLASDDSSYITGIDLCVDGGFAQV